MAAAGDDQAGSAVPAVVLRSGKPMPRIGLGTASFPLGDAGDRPVVREALLRALDAGYRHFDTAAVYGTERAIGDAVAEAVRAGTLASRDQVYITSKLWIADAHPSHVLPALRKTLQNLQMEYVDLYLIHFPVSMRLPEAEVGAGPVLAKENLVEMDMKGVWDEMEECHRGGLAKAIGVSNFSCKKLEYLLSFAKIPPAVNQVSDWIPFPLDLMTTSNTRTKQTMRFSSFSDLMTTSNTDDDLRSTAPPYRRSGPAGVAVPNVEVHPCCRQNKLRVFCREKGIQLCAYSPLGGKGAPWANNSVINCPLLRQIAHTKGKTVAQVCIRWVYEQGDCLIAKSFNEKRMRENLDIFDWQLTEDECREISTLPESRGTYDFFVHESGPYKTAQEFWDGEIVAGQANNSALSLDPTN